MVIVKNIDFRWMRRYKYCFVIGIIILISQLLLAIGFFAVSNDSSNMQWNRQKLPKYDVNDAESNVNSARRSKDGFLLDDEDIKYEKHVKKSYKNVTKLRLEELDFVPVCEIAAKEAISAIHRAKTQKCKQKISNITCLIQQELLYPQTLPHHCHNDGFVQGKSLGCFKDDKTYRLLNGYYGNNKKHNSPAYCIHLCLQSGYQYAGVQYSTECFCGNDEPLSTEKLPDSSCNMKCPSDPHLACGGYYTINIYQTGIKKFIPQLAETSSTNQSPVKIVFLLTLNGRALRQVKRLIKILYHQDHYFYIHVDVRQNYLFRELGQLEKFPNIRLTRKRYATIWGGASLLTMLLSTMKELLHTNWKWDFVLNLSESDYPVKVTSRLVEFLTANRDKNFVKSHGREVQRFIQKQGLDKTFVECDTHMWRIGDRRLPWGIQIDGGSDWVALSRKFVSYVASDTPDELANGLYVVFKHTLLPAESFFHTVLRNSKFCNTYVDNNLHVTNWKRKLGCKCQYRHVVDWCGCSPNDFKPEDWLRIQNTESRQLFFARKFEPIINQAVILQLEQWLYGIDLSHVVNIHSYWHNIYNHLELDSSIDDSLLTVTNSIIRTVSKALSSDTCTVNPNKILDVTSFHIKDSYKKTLILFEATVSNVKVIIETSMQLKNTLILKKSDFIKRLKYLSVSSDYDQKEQILRNFAGVLGPYSEPTLVYEFDSNPESSLNNVTFLWLDPTGRLVEVLEVPIDDGHSIGYQKPSFRQPLIPGIWIVKLLYKNEQLGEIKFLISPLEYFSGNVMSQNQIKFIHGGSGVHKDFGSNWDNYLANEIDQERLEQLSISNSKRFGIDLQEWIDTLVNKFYTVGQSCVLNNGTICGKTLNKCVLTNWSSFAPDPKSTIDKVNRTTGTFNPW